MLWSARERQERDLEKLIQTVNVVVNIGQSLQEKMLKVGWMERSSRSVCKPTS